MNLSQLSVGNIAGQLRCRRVVPLLVPYADDRLRRAERERVEAHLETCPACRAQTQTIAGVGALLRDASLNASLPVADLSPNLWANVEAEIRRSGVPLDRSAESPLLRPRRRAGLVWDAAWPNSVPVAAAVFSAVVFGTVLLNHHALNAPALRAGSAASHADKSGAAITVAMRLAVAATAPAAALASEPGAAPRSATVPMSLARVQTSALPQAAPRFPVTANTRRFAPMPLKNDLVASLLEPVVPVASVVAPSHAVPAALSFVSVAKRSIRMTVAEAKIASEPTGATAGLSVEKQPRLADAAHSIDADASDASDVAAVKPTEPSRMASMTAVTAMPTAPAATMSVSDGAAIVSAAKTDDDATVRSGAPADQPMADFAAISRRQRNLFSYTSR